MLIIRAAHDCRSDFNKNDFDMIFVPLIFTYFFFLKTSFFMRPIRANEDFEKLAHNLLKHVILA